MTVRPRAIVTGAEGFIGARVSRALADAGYAVDGVGLGSRRDPLSMSRLAPAFEEDVSLVVDCAGGSSVDRSLREPLADFDKTIPPLAQLLELIRTRSPAARLVLLSSGAVYGSAARTPTPEETPAAPISPYGLHKQLCETLCTAYGRLHGVSVAILRLFSVYGAGLRKQLFWDACCKARSGDVRFSGTGREVRDWLHVDDAVSLILAVSEVASPEAPVFNGGTGRGTSVREVLWQIAEHMGVPPPVFGGDVRAGDPLCYTADISRARALRWVPRIGLARGISEYVAWFRAGP